MRLVILGATGPTGQYLVTQALEAGHDVTAIVRNPDKMATSHDKLKVVKGDIFSSETSLQELMAGHDVVLSCLGARSGRNDTTFYSESIKSVTAAVRAANINRLIAITAWCTTDEKGPFLIDWIIKPLFLKKALANMGEMEAYLKVECADINYTVVKPPGLSNGNVTDKVIKTEDGQYVHGVSSRILRADVARFMLSCLDTDEWDRKLVSIGY